MTVHFKGISEYRSKYKSRTTRSRSDSPHRRMRLAGLRSDQSRITREPQFTSRRKVPFYPPQVSSSFRWEGHGSSPQRQEKTRPVTPPVVTPVLRATSAERVATPLAPRGPVPPEGTAAPSHQLQAEAQAAQTSTSTGDQQRPNGINHALRRRAGLRSERQRNGRLNSEYQRQFMWKTPVADSPLLAAQEMLYSNNRAIPPFKSNPVIMESEYRRSFKGSPPPRPPRLRRDVEQHEVPLLHTENTTPEKSKRKKKKERQHSRKSSPAEEVTHLQQQEVRSPFAMRDPSPKTMRKVKTEYRSNFRSPLQYNYRDGAWVKARTAKEEECDGFHEWYHEVRDLRERAEAYRKRAWGTHFSRQHLNQILSDHNWMWEPSSGTSSSSIESEACRSTSSSPIIEALDLARAGSARGSSSPGPSASVAASRRTSPGEAGLPEDPTLPVQRKLAWDEEKGQGEREESEISQEAWNPKYEHGNMKQRNERLQLLETESSSVVQGSGGSINGGRLPTPKLKTMQTAQRTHHDRTTPATGGALLVSPPKIKHSSRKVRRSEPPLGKPHSPYKLIIDRSPQRPHNKAENGSLPRSSPPAGLTTVDLLPMREDAWSEDEAAADYTNPRQAKPSQKQTIHHQKAAVPPHANRIQGQMRNPEFQHNGNLGIFRPELFEFPESDSGVSDNDDKMSQISSRSAASCSVASEVLGRAQRRKEEFWGKS